MRNFKLLIASILAGVISLMFTSCSETNINNGRIKPSPENPKYWSYKEQSVLLLGGTNDDNLFQMDTLENHLDRLKEVGGNFIRNTMSSRDSGNVWPFAKNNEGFFDLNTWNQEYWNRFEKMLKLCDEREIVIQLEIWDRFDYSNEYWLGNPYNPGYNVNYTYEETGLADAYPKHPISDLQPFFHTVKDMARYTEKLEIVRMYQEKYIDKLLSHSLQYGNVLYCMNNETSTPLEWGKYWMNFIRQRAGEKEVYVTDMPGYFNRPVSCTKCQEILQNIAEYTFIEASQVNSRNVGQNHWDTIVYIVQQRDMRQLRPINCTKVYGGENTSWGSGSKQDGIERFCRNVLAGCAVVRHHRPIYGNGINSKSKASIEAIRKVESIVKFWDIDFNNKLLSERESNEAYLAAKPGESYVIYFPKGGNVVLKLPDNINTYSQSWINVTTGEWGKSAKVTGSDKMEIEVPEDNGWFVVLKRQS